MATIIVNENMKGAKEFLNFVKSLPFVKITDKTDKKPNARTRKAMKQAEKGIGLTETENVQDFFDKLNS